MVGNAITRRRDSSSADEQKDDQDDRFRRTALHDGR